MRVVMISRMQGLGHYSLMVAKEMGCEVFILCESTAEAQRLGNVRVIPCWHRQGFIHDLMEELKRLKPNVVCVQHEIFLFGSLVSAFLVPWLLLKIRRLRIPIVLTVHHVIPRRLFRRDFMKALGLPVWPRITRLGYQLLLNALLALSRTALATEEWLGSELKGYAPVFRDKVAILLLGVVTDPPAIDQHRAKSELMLADKRIALFWGYLAFYKGVEVLIEAAGFLQRWGTNWVVVIVGGLPYRVSERPDEVDLGFLRNSRLNLTSNIKMEGFISEDMIPTYLSAADVVVFPYRYLFSASGPLSTAVAFEKRVLVSQAFSDVISERSLIFETKPEILAHRIVQSSDDDALARDAAALAANWKRTRDWSSVSKLYSRICQKALLVSSPVLPTQHTDRSC